MPRSIALLMAYADWARRGLGANADEAERAAKNDVARAKRKKCTPARSRRRTNIKMDLRAKFVMDCMTKK